MNKKDKKSVIKDRKKRKTSEESKPEIKTKKKRKMLRREMAEEKEDLAEQKEDITTEQEKKNDSPLLLENDGNEIVELEVEEEQQKDKNERVEGLSKVTPNNVNLNPKKVFQIEDLGSPNRLLDYTRDDSDDDGIHGHRMTIQEAFANDDVIEEFVKEKDDAVESGKAKDLDTSLPGWGAWGGPGVDETKRKRKFIVPGKRVSTRKDAKLAHVIINEENDKKFAKNQITAVPFPYTSHDQWERSIRAPLGKHWNTASVHHKLVKGRVTTLPGTIIEPLKATKDVPHARADENNTKHGKKRNVKIMGSGIKIHT